MDMPQGDGGASENRRRGPGRRSSSGHGGEAAADGAAQAPATAPCGACKFLRRKCVSGCIFAPHFGSDQGAARFAAVHKVFGASNVSKLLTHIPANRRQDAVVTISYEAQARLSDPVYGCVSTIIALQQQVASLQAELSVVQTQLINSRFVLANTLHHQNSPHQQNQHQTQHHIIINNDNNNIGAAYSNTSSASNCNNLITNLHHNNNNSTFSTNFAETAPSNNSFEPVNLHLSGRALQDEDEEEEESHDPAVAFANHIFR
ncbi:hypothetical protein ABFS83_10G145700 [Erythranthe nasuta]